MSCIVKTHNGEESKVVNQLIDITGNEAEGRKFYSYFKAKEFINIFGEYRIPKLELEKDEDLLNRTDEVGEPKLFFNKALNNYYFLDKNNEPIFYPSNHGFIEGSENQELTTSYAPYGNGLHQHHSSEDISTVAQMLALEFYNNFTQNYDEVVFDNENNVKLRTVIEDFLGVKTSELLKSTDWSEKARGMALNASKGEIDLWEEEVKKFFNTLNVKLGIEEKVISEEKELRGALMRVESFLKSNKNNVNNNIKLFLALMETSTSNKFAGFNFVPFDDIYSTLNKTLANKIAGTNSRGEIEDLFEIFKEEILKVGEVKPYLLNLHKELNSKEITDAFKNQFVAAFNLYTKNFLGSEIYYENGEIYYDVKNLSDLSSRKKTTLSMWDYNSSLLGISKNNYNMSLQDINRFLSGSTAFKPDDASAEDLVAAKLEIMTILFDLGIITNAKSFDYFLSQQRGKGVLERSKSLRDSAQNIKRAISEQLTVGNKNSFFDQSVIKKIAEAYAFFIEEGTDASFHTLGKTKWMYSLPSYLERIIAGWKKDPQLLQDHYDSNDYTMSSAYAEWLLALEVEDEVSRLKERQKRINNIEIGVFNSIQQKYNSINASDNSELSYTDSLNDYLNKLLAYRKSGKIWHKTALAAGKNTEYQINWGSASDVFSMSSGVEMVDGVMTINSAITELFYKYFKAEYQRMSFERKYIEEGKDLKVFYHLGQKNALKSQLFPSMSIEFGENGEVIVPDLPFILYDEAGVPIHNNLDVIKDEILSYIDKILKTNIYETADTLKANEIFTFDENGRRINNGLDSVIYNSFLQEAGKDKNGEYKSDTAILKIAGDVFVNSVISQVEYSKMISGDVAYYKSFTDYNKRGSAPYTDGTYLRLGKNEKIFNIATIKAVEIPTPNLEKLKAILPEEIWKRYLEVNATDGQAWITPERWKFIMQRIGKWNSVTESAFKKFYNPNAKFSTKELKVLAQPLKGVYFDNTKGHPVFLKYSQAVLLPGLIKGTSLQNIFDKMTKDKNGKTLKYEDQIHELITEDGIKAGSFNPTVTHDADGNVNLKGDLIKMKAFNASWKLQQDLPTKGAKSTTLGSQIQKNIFQGLTKENLSKIFQVGEVEMTGEQLVNHINDITGEMSNKGIKHVLTRLGVDPETFKIKDESILFEGLIRQLEKRNDIPANFLNALKARTSPYGIPGASQLFQNAFSTIINEATIRIKTNGGGFIQMADYGLSKDEAEEQDILFTPWFDKLAKKLSPPVLGINPKNGKSIIEPGGIFIGGAFIAKYVPDYKEMDSEELFGKLNPKTGKYEGGVIDQDILKNIIGYRIPNQALSSNDALQVMGILPEGMGDTIIAYTGITEKTGSDFDIDKMYLMIPNFHPYYEQDVEKQINTFFDKHLPTFSDIEAELYYLGHNPEKFSKSEAYALLRYEILINSEYELSDEFFSTNKIKSAKRLIYLSAEDENLPIYSYNNRVLQNKLIEAYKAVLASPHTIKDVMNPIEFPHLKNDIKNIIGEEEQKDLQGFNAIANLKLKNEFRLGGAGLGQSVNSLVDSVLGSMADLSLTDYGLVWGHHNEKGDTIFDEEYSEELTDTDIREYVTSYNKTAAKKIKIEDVKKLRKIKLNDAMMGSVNGFVDVEKDQYIIQGNWVTQTNNVGFMLLRSGAHMFKVNAFMAQPILQDFIAYQNNQESSTIDKPKDIEFRFKVRQAAESISEQGDFNINGVTLNKKELLLSLFGSRNASILTRKYKSGDGFLQAKDVFFLSAKQTLYKKFKIGYSEITPSINSELDSTIEELKAAFDSIFEAEEIDFSTLSLKDLRDQIDNKDLATQVAIFNTFMEWKDKAKVVLKNINASKTSVDGKGKNITSLITSLNRITDILYNPEFTGFASKLHIKGNHNALAYHIENSLNIPLKIMQANPKFFITANPTAINTFNVISKYIYGNKLDNQILGDKLEKAYYSYVLSGFKPLLMSQEEQNTLLNTLPEQIMELHKTEAISNKLITEFAFNFSNYNNITFLSMPNIKKGVGFKNSLTDAWNDLFETHPKIAEDLVKYSYLTSGFNNAISQFHEYIPYQWFNKNRFNSYLQNLPILPNSIDMVFINQFFRHSVADNKIARRIFESGMNTLQDKRINSGYIGTVIDEKNPAYLTYLLDEEEGGEPMYYEYAGVNKNGYSIYTITTPLGFSDRKNNKLFEYSIFHPSELHGMPSNFHELIAVNKKLISQIREVESRDIPIDGEITTTPIDIQEVINEDYIEEGNTGQTKLFNLEDNKLNFNNATLEKLYNFLENIKVPIKFNSEKIGGILAKADFQNGIIEVLRNEDNQEWWNNIPEETAHFWFRLLDENSKIRKDLFDIANSLPEFKKVTDDNSPYFQLLKEGELTYTDLKEEAIGKAITKILHRIQTKEANENEKNWVKQFINWIKSLFTSEYKYPVAVNIAAERILNSDLKDLMSVEELKEQYKVYYGEVEVSPTINDNQTQKEHKEWMLKSISERDSKWYEGILNRSRIRTKFLPKTFDKLSKQGKGDNKLEKIKLEPEQKEDLIYKNKYTNIIPELASYDQLRKKFKNNKISLKTPINLQIKKGDLNIYNEVRELIAKEQEGKMKSIFVDNFIEEVKNFLNLHYSLGFAEEKNHLDYRIANTFKYVSTSKTHPFLANREDVFEDIDPWDVDVESDVRHRKISLRFNDEFFKQFSHFQLSPTAWGNITYFRSKEGEKDSALLHEIQNDFIEKIKGSKDGNISSYLPAIMRHLGVPSLFNHLNYLSTSEEQFNVFKERMDEYKQLNDITLVSNNLNRVNESIEKQYAKLTELRYMQKTDTLLSDGLVDDIVTLFELKKEQFERGYTNLAAFDALSQPLMVDINNELQKIDTWGGEMQNIIYSFLYNSKMLIHSKKQLKFLLYRSLKNKKDKELLGDKVQRSNIYKVISKLNAIVKYEELSLEEFTPIYENIKENINNIKKGLKLEESGKQFEKDENYFTPLVHHLIQTVIKEKGRNFPIYLSGYSITKLTQGSEATAKIYAGKEEVSLGLVDKVGPLHSAFRKIKGVKLEYIDNIEGFKNQISDEESGNEIQKVGGYKLDISNYNFKTPILYKLEESNQSGVFDFKCK